MLTYKDWYYVLGNTIGFKDYDKIKEIFPDNIITQKNMIDLHNKWYSQKEKINISDKVLSMILKYYHETGNYQKLLHFINNSINKICGWVVIENEKYKLINSDKLVEKKWMNPETDNIKVVVESDNSIKIVIGEKCERYYNLNYEFVIKWID